MKKLFIIFLISLPLFSQKIINIACVPWKAPEDLQTFYKPLFKLIEDKTKYKINFMIAKDYLELSQRINNKSVDIGLFGSNSYIEAKKKNPYLIYLATINFPKDHYYSLIVSKKDSKLKTIKDLKDKNFAFTDIGSTSGYVYPSLMLYKSGIKEPKNYFKSVSMLKKHYKVYNAIAKGSIDAGGCSITSLQNAIEDNGDIYHIIKKSKPIPSDPITAGAHLDKKLIKKLKKIFKESKNSNYFNKYKSDLKGLSVRDDSFYDIVREANSFVKNKDK